MNLAPLDALWVYLSASPLLHLLLTLVAFLLATAINRLARGASLAHPVLVSIALIIAFLWLTDTDYPTYFEGAQFIHFLLGPRAGPRSARVIRGHSGLVRGRVDGNGLQRR